LTDTTDEHGVCYSFRLQGHSENAVFGSASAGAQRPSTGVVTIQVAATENPGRPSIQGVVYAHFAPTVGKVSIEQVVTAMAKRGFEVRPPQVVRGLKVNAVRYFHQSDEKVARLLKPVCDEAAQDLCLLQDFSITQYAVPNGQLEVWLARAR